jgi:hypothetical protein
MAVVRHWNPQKQPVEGAQIGRLPQVDWKAQAEAFIYLRMDLSINGRKSMQTINNNNTVEFEKDQGELQVDQIEEIRKLEFREAQRRSRKVEFEGWFQDAEVTEIENQGVIQCGFRAEQLKEFRKVEFRESRLTLMKLEVQGVQVRKLQTAEFQVERSAALEVPRALLEDARPPPPPPRPPPHPPSPPPPPMRDPQLYQTFSALFAKLGGASMPIPRYVETFGWPTPDKHPFGDKVFEGMQALHSNDPKYSWYPVKECKWFKAPYPFSRAKAQLHSDCDDCGDWAPYPALLLSGTEYGATVGMRCLALIILGSKSWQVHWMRLRACRCCGSSSSSSSGSGSSSSSSSSSTACC